MGSPSIGWCDRYALSFFDLKPHRSRAPRRYRCRARGRSPALSRSVMSKRGGPQWKTLSIGSPFRTASFGRAVPGDPDARPRVEAGRPVEPPRGVAASGLPSGAEADDVHGRVSRRQQGSRAVALTNRASQQTLPTAVCPLPTFIPAQTTRGRSPRGSGGCRARRRGA